MPDINVNKLSEALNTKADIDLNNTGVFSTSSGVVNLVQSTPSDAKGREVASADFSLKQGGLELMDVGFAPLGIDESENKRRYLNGQVISQSQFPAFTAAVKARMTTMANAFTTESNWQAEKTNSKLGQCGKFVVDDTAGTIRLPAVVNAQGLLSLSGIGNLMNESLPNITGNFYGGLGAYTTYGTGAFYEDTTSTAVTDKTANGGNVGMHRFGFDASRSSSTYQTGAHVQQEAVQYPYYIQVATGVEETLPAIREYNINTPFFFGQSMYSDVAPDNASWLASNGQYNAKTVYPDYYDWLVEQMNNGVSGFVASTATYTDYDFVINTADQTFRLPLLNGVRVLVKKYVSGTDWYNLYSDGWCEQGGAHTFTNVTTSAQSVDINLLKAMRFYSSSICSRSVSGDWGAGTYTIIQTTGTNLNLAAYSFRNAIGTVTVDWSVRGYAEIPTQSDFTEVAGLYFYVGDTVQDASLINAGAVLNDVANLKAHAIVETYRNGTEWYRIYSDGWCEQGGFAAPVSADGHACTVTFLKPFLDTSYGFFKTNQTTSNATNVLFVESYSSKTNTSIKIYNFNTYVSGASWIACGYIR